MIKGLEELKRMAYENACCRCQYYKDKECTNKGNCVWKTIEINLKALDIIRKYIIMNRAFKDQTKGQSDMTLIEIKALVPDSEYDLVEEVLK